VVADIRNATMLLRSRGHAQEKRQSAQGPEVQPRV